MKYMLSLLSLLSLFSIYYYEPFILKLFAFFHLVSAVFILQLLQGRCKCYHVKIKMEKVEEMVHNCLNGSLLQSWIFFP